MHSLRLLHLEDNEQDADLVRRTLALEELHCQIVHVTNRKDFEHALGQGGYDLVVTDYAIPGWNGLEALACVRALDRAVPFIFFSGALGEERAVEALRCGATDYVLKNRLSRLLPVIRRALAEVEDRLRREQAERGLREAEQRYRLLFEQSPVAIVVLDPATTVPLEFNDEACRQLRYSRDEFARMTLLQHFGDDQSEGVRNRLAEAQQTGRAEFETRQRTKAGDLRSVWVIVRLVQIQGRSAFYTLWRDITARQETERRLLRSQRLESIGTLASGIAHDLNNALAPILMGGSLLREGASSETLALLDLIESGAQRSAAMVRQLLTFAKGIDGQRVLLQPRHLVRDMEKLVRGTFPKNIQLQTRVARDVGLVLGDATQLHQVLLNLCVNARDSMPNGGVLSLHMANEDVDHALTDNPEGAQPGRYVVIRVGDVGTGIAPEILDRIFDPFFTTKSPDKGTGMGLSTVLGIIRSHRGFIRVQSQLGSGSKFSVYLPLAEGKQSDTEVVQGAAEFRASGELVLLVDDDTAVRNSVALLLERLNLRVLGSASGHEALISFAQHRAEIRLIICDLQMPHMDGVVLVQALRRMAPQANVIVMSGNANERQLAELNALGVSAILAKPFAVNQLVETLRHLLGEEPTSH